jgi:hypothetical protein
MRRHRNPALILAVALAGAGAAMATATAETPPGERAWKDFISPDGRFTVQFPGTPKQASQTQTTKLGPLDAKVFLLELPDGLYAVWYVDYPREALARNRPDELLDGARDGAVANVKGKLAGETKITQNGFPGRELRIEVTTRKGVAAATVRLYFVKERLYQAIVVMDKAREAQTEIRKFLDSFRFEP